MDWALPKASADYDPERHWPPELKPMTRLGLAGWTHPGVGVPQAQKGQRTHPCHTASSGVGQGLSYSFWVGQSGI